MRIFLFFLVIIICAGPAFAAMQEKRVLNYDGVEFVIRNDPNDPSKIGMAKYAQGKLIFDVNYTLDAKGFRIGPHSNQASKTSHFLIIGGSIAFGEGLNDNETIHDLINARSKEVEAYAIGTAGDGPQHHWMRFKSGELGNHIRQKKGSAIIITSDADIAKFTGNLMTLPFSYQFPRIIQDESGLFVNVGTFEKGGTFLQELLSRACFPYMFCTNLINKLEMKVSHDEIILGSKLINAVAEMYRKQFDVEKMTVVWMGTPNGGKLFKAYSNLKMAYVPFDAYVDGHPNKQGAEEIVRELFRLKIVH